MTHPEYFFAGLWLLSSYMTWMFAATGDGKGWNEGDHPVQGRTVFWIGLFAPLVLLFLAGFWLARVLGYLFYLRKSV